MYNWFFSLSLYLKVPLLLAWAFFYHIFLLEFFLFHSSNIFGKNGMYIFCIDGRLSIYLFIYFFCVPV